MKKHSNLKTPHFDLGLPAWLDPLLRGSLGIRKLERIYGATRALAEEGDGAGEFSRNALKELGVSYEVPAERIRALRELKGPLLFVANHPFGAIDALILLAVMSEARKDYRFMATSLLEVLPEMKAALIPIEVRASKLSAGVNLSALRSAFRHLRAGGTLGMFPSGEVAERTSWRDPKPREREWHPHLASLVTRTGATVIPVFFEGENSRLFQFVGLTLPKFRMAFLAHEMLRFKSPARFTIGEPFEIPNELREAKDPRVMAQYLKDRTYATAPGLHR